MADKAKSKCIRAESKYIRTSPYKLRPIADVIRGGTVQNALAWLQTCSLKRARSIEKTLFSAFSNARQKDQKISMNDLYVKEIRIDQGPVFKYSKPAAMGRASIQRRKLSHVKIVLDKKTD